MKVYISGRIKDYEDYSAHFDIGVEILQDAGHIAVNPCTLGKVGMTIPEFMREDIRELLDCEAILMLKGWEHSAGARCEFLVAAMCGLEIWYEDGLVGVRVASG